MLIVADKEDHSQSCYSELQSKQTSCYSKLKSKQASEHAREQESHLLEVGRGARQQRGVALGAFLHLVELGCVQRLPGLRAQLVRDAC